MFPIWDQGGRVIGFGGRLLADGVRAPKYLNSPETALFSKRNTLYGAHLAEKAAKESATHHRRRRVHRLYQFVSTRHRKRRRVVGHRVYRAAGALAGALAEKIIIAFDADAAGEAATLRSLDMLAELGMRVAVVTMPPGQDPDEFVRQQGRRSFSSSGRHSGAVDGIQVEQGVGRVDVEHRRRSSPGRRTGRGHRRTS